MKNLVTLAGRSKMAKARAGIVDLPAITHIALGDGGVDSDNNVLEPGEQLAHELIKKEVSSITKVSDTCYRFSIVLGEAEMTDAEISEMALIDSEGDTVIVEGIDGETKVKVCIIFEREEIKSEIPESFYKSVIRKC